MVLSARLEKQEIVHKERAVHRGSSFSINGFITNDLREREVGTVHGLSFWEKGPEKGGCQVNWFYLAFIMKKY